MPQVEKYGAPRLGQVVTLNVGFMERLLFTYMKPLSETSSRQAAFSRVNHRLTPRSKTLLDRTPSEFSDAQCGRFDA